MIGGGLFYQAWSRHSLFLFIGSGLEVTYGPTWQNRNPQMPSDLNRSDLLTELIYNQIFSRSCPAYSYLIKFAQRKVYRFSNLCCRRSQRQDNHVGAAGENPPDGLASKDCGHVGRRKPACHSQDAALQASTPSRLVVEKLLARLAF